MSTYHFKMRDYHAVKEADIEIKGITVVGGVNGCGKSTIARWLNYVVNVLNNYEKYVVEEANESFDELTSILSRAATLSFKLRMEWLREKSKISDSDDIDEVTSTFKAHVERFADLLLKEVTPRNWETNRRRFSSLFELEEIEDETLPHFIERFTDTLSERSNAIYEIAASRLRRHTLKNWKEILLERIDLSIDDTKIDLSFSEDGVSLLGEKDFAMPLMLRNAIYINTQEITAALGPSFREGGDLWPMLQKKSNLSTERGRLIAKIIRKIIGGDVVVNNPQGGYSAHRNRLHYVRPDGLDILLRGAATGIISFSILLQLLENGWITENTLLIIDEPEAHLHPQWIVEYARVLVIINKILGTKIFVSTHNPDMLAALQSISDREDTLPQTLFYLAEKQETTGKFVYRNLGREIGPIFDSFNIALDRIEQYGSSVPPADNY